MAQHPQDTAQSLSLMSPDSFWALQAKQLHWHEPPSVTLSRTTKTLRRGVSHDHWEWFPDGEISTCYNCVDRHVAAGNGDRIALFWESPVTRTQQHMTYQNLLDEVSTLGGVLQEQGVKKGDVVLIYMPMIPAAVIGMLATSRIGAVHVVVFGGFAANSLAQRIQTSRPVLILTASCGIDGAKPPQSYRPMVLEALATAQSPAKVLVWQRDQLPWPSVDDAAGHSCWQELVQSARERGVTSACVPVKSSDTLYIIHSSGTTGQPKGVVREAGGHAVGLQLSMRYLFGVCQPGDVMFCASDIGWVVGHSYIVYGPLLVGASTVLYEGKPVGTPDAGAFWRTVEAYRATALFTAPTALRAIRRADPDNHFLHAVGARGGLCSLHALFLAGERSEPALVSMYEGLLQKYGKHGATVIDNWWSSESGSPISGRALRPHAATGTLTSALPAATPHPIRPGSAGKAMPGFDVRVVDDGGHEVARGQMGNIVMALPLAPTAFRTLWDDADRFYTSYLERFGGRWVDTGDAGMIDADGYIHVLSRSDDIINVAAHRLSTGTIEQAVASHAAVAECCVVGIPDALKGQLPFAFITLATPAHPTSALPAPALAAEIQQRVRAQIGAIASLGGIVQGKGMIPKTRSGKTLRRVLRDLLENAVHGELDRELQVPPTIDDASTVVVARDKVREYFAERGQQHQAPEARSKL